MLAQSFFYISIALASGPAPSIYYDAQPSMQLATSYEFDQVTAQRLYEIEKDLAKFDELDLVEDHLKKAQTLVEKHAFDIFLDWKDLCKAVAHAEDAEAGLINVVSKLSETSKKVFSSNALYRMTRPAQDLKSECSKPWVFRSKARATMTVFKITDALKAVKDTKDYYRKRVVELRNSIPASAQIESGMREPKVVRIEDLPILPTSVWNLPNAKGDTIELDEPDVIELDEVKPTK